MNRLTIILLILVYGQLFGQKQNNIWYFGQYAGLDFSSGSPVALNDGALYTVEGCAAISDSSGNFQFYTDGITVWDRTHNQMPNGFGLLGHKSSTQSALIVPKPGDCKIYYIFTTPAQDTITPLSYSEVDMTLNGGMGDVTVKNIALYSPVTERLTATLHSNGLDYWVIAQEYGTNGFLAYLISNSGLYPTPVLSYSGKAQTANWDMLGYMNVSPDGSKLCYASLYGGYSELLDFNNTNGTVANALTIDSPILGSGTYGVEFSPDNSRLYLSTLNFPPILWQYNLLAGTPSAILSSVVAVNDTINPSNLYLAALMLGPDGKIYASQLSKKYLGVINDPDSLGTACNFVDSVVYLGSGKCQDGLPNLIKAYSSCAGEIGTEELDKSVRVIIYPNPTKQHATLEFDNFEQNHHTLTLYDTKGRLARSIDNITTNQVIIEKENLTSGLYFFQLCTDRQVRAIGKLIIE